MRKLIISLLAIAVMLVPLCADVFEYLDPQLGSGIEFLQVKGPVITGTARAFVGNGHLKGFNVRVGGLIGDGMKPGFLLGPSLDIAQVTRGKIDFVLKYAVADLSLMGGVMMIPGEEETKYEGLLCLAITLVGRQ